MKRRQGLLAAFGASVALCSPLARAQTPVRPVGEVKSLGQERYQIGRIVVDKRARSFTVPGRVQVLGKPLEYLATSPGGRRGYEALLELDTGGSEMNLACILIGLERDPAVPSWKPLAEAGQVGERVTLWLAWGHGGERRRVAAAEALLDDEGATRAAAVEWAYTGSFTSADGRQLAADVTGSLISFIERDRSGIIEAVSDESLGPYGTVRGNVMLPPEGSAVDLIVEAGKASK